jgi:hypothetical protein
MIMSVSPKLQPKLSELGGATSSGVSFSHAVMRALAATLAMTSSATATYAAGCGMASLGGGDAGPPSISATESSTTQVLEEIRRRTQAAEQQAQPIPVSNTTPAAEAQASAGSEAAPPKTTSGSAPKKPKYKQAASTEPTASQQGYVYPEVMGGTERIMSSWGQGFLDWEHHDNIAPGQEENRGRTSKTAGVVSGTDWTWVNPAARQAVQVGYFSGYSATFNSFGNTNFTASSGGDTDNVNRTDSKQKIDGSFLGGYLAAVKGNATFDLAFKADLFDLHQSSTLTQTDDTCGHPSAIESGSASVNNYTIAADAAYRYNVSPTGWYEPIFSIRYTLTDYGNDPTHFTSINPTVPDLNINTSGRLGLEDGTVLRLQGGIRRGEHGVLPDGGLWTVVGGAYIYSDVLITGFKFNPGVAADGTPLGTTVFPVDEGKVRGLGQILTTFDYANGWSYLMMGEVRGGEDLIGVDGRVGARYRW